ncbi:11408_t:CDS:2 [Funneliformis mosseae]|uniref:11408_t:CDS:1 n=1 Tax=Funneliformis mosseae TaxID=27381 RepID=A0A9N9C6U1_FUNMO|nr:11408_t:CDS:2 [Funneliformis mosseae]
MEESLHLSNDTIGQIKNFEYFSLTVEQSTLIDKLILNEGLKARYKKYGLFALKCLHGLENITDEFLNEQFEEADEMNKLRSTTSSDDDLSYTTHPRAYYTSRFLDFKNLSAPKIANDDNNDNPSEIEDSESVTIDFSKLRINSKVIAEKEIKDTVKD